MKHHLIKLDWSILYCIMSTFRTVVIIVDIFLDLVFGHTIQYGSRDERKRSENDYEHSAQVVNIIGRGAYSLNIEYQLHNFVWRHEEYKHPHYILEHDNITLMGLTTTHAFFCVTDQDFDIYDIKIAPFMFIAQFLAAKKLIILPHPSFNRLAAEVGDATVCKMTFVNMTARCGSTLLGQMVAQTPKVLVMSEPRALVHTHGQYMSKNISMAEYKRVLRSVVRLQCKREHGRNVEHIFIKTTLWMSPAFPMLKEMFPKAKFIFNTRGFKETVESLMQLVKFQGLIALHTGAVFRSWWRNVQIPYDDPFFYDLHKEWKVRCTTFEVRLAFGFACQISQFMRTRHDYNFVVFYEDLLSNKEKVCRELLEVCEIPLEYVPQALNAFKTDSQQGIFGKRGDKPKVDPAILDQADKVFAECGLPLMSKISTPEFKNLVLARTYTMRSEFDRPSQGYEKMGLFMK